MIGNAPLRGAFEQPEPPDPRSDVELVAQLAGDPTALAVLYDRYSALVYGLALRSLENADEAQDLTQEIFMNLRTDRHFDAARGSLGAYLTRSEEHTSELQSQSNLV